MKIGEPMTQHLRLIVLVGLAVTIASCIGNTPIPPTQKLPMPTLTPVVQTTRPIAVPTAAPTSAPAITLNPATGGPQTLVTVTGKNLPPGTSVSLRVSSATEGGNSMTFGGVMTDEQGRVNLSLAIPDRWPNGAMITEKELVFLVADASSRIIATAQFNFQSIAAITPTPVVMPTVMASPSATPPPAQNPAASVSATWLNVRSGPGSNYSLITRLDQGQEMNLLGRTTDNTWVQVRLPGGQEGWVPTSSIKANVPLTRLPVKAPPEVAPTLEPIYQASAYVTFRSTFLRSGPGGNFSLIQRLEQGQGLTLVGRNATSTWVQVYLSEGLQGWVLAAHVDADSPISDLPVTAGTPTPSPATPTPGPVAYPVSGPLQLRSGPGSNYSLIVVSALGRSQAISLIGRNGAATWVQVELPDGHIGWVTTDSIQPSSPVTDLPVIADPQPRVTLSNLAVSLGASIQVNVQGFYSDQEIVVTLNAPGTSRSLIVARGMTNARGAAQLLFTMPGRWPDGTPIAQGDLTLIVSSPDGNVSTSVYLRYLG